MRPLRLILWLGLAIALALVPAAQAQDGFPTDDDVNNVAKQLYCPVCPNTPLDVCETKACQDWREEIRNQLSAGWSEEEISAYFVERYGERVLAEPERQGFTSLVWILPAVAMVLGLTVVVQALRSWRRRRQQELPRIEGTVVTDAGQISAETRARIERELQELL